MIKTIFWDNDGVLVASEELFFKISKHAFLSLGINLTKNLWGTMYLAQGMHSREIAHKLGAKPTLIEPVLENRNQAFSAALKNPPSIQLKVPETLKKLKGKIKMIMVTGCHRKNLNIMHKNTGILDFFNEVITGDDYAKGKPHPEPYLRAMEISGNTAEEVIAVEDSQKGLTSAVTAGIKCIVIPTELTAMHDFKDAIAIEKDVSDVLKYV